MEDQKTTLDASPNFGCEDVKVFLRETHGGKKKHALRISQHHPFFLGGFVKVSLMIRLLKENQSPFGLEPIFFAES